MFMKAENISRMGTQVRDNVAEIADKARDLSAKVKDRLEETYSDLERTVRRAKTATEDRLEDVRDRVKERPLTSVATVAAGSLAVGILIGWLLGAQGFMLHAHQLPGLGGDVLGTDLELFDQFPGSTAITKAIFHANGAREDGSAIELLARGDDAADAPGQGPDLVLLRGHNDPSLSCGPHYGGFIQRLER